MGSDTFDWSKASKEELLALARCTDSKTRDTACRYLRDHIHGRSWSNAETLQVLQALVDMIRPGEDSFFLQGVLGCLIDGPRPRALDARAVLRAMGEDDENKDDWNIGWNLRILCRCGESYWPIATAFRQIPGFRETIDAVIPASIPANNEGLLALARRLGESERYVVCRCVRDNVRARTWSDAEIRRVLQGLVDLIQPWGDRRFLERVYECMVAAPPGLELDAKVVLEAMAEDNLNVCEYLQILHKCGPSYRPIVAAHREDERPWVREIAEALLAGDNPR